MDRVQLSIVDAFCGGGLLQTDNGPAFGSPLRILQAVELAERRINQDRRKPLCIEAKYFFSDIDPHHIAYLDKSLRDFGYGSRIGKDIHLTTQSAEQAIDSHAGLIVNRNAPSKAIFVLDQFGYKDVPMESLRLIAHKLAKAEVILTLGVDAMLNYLTEDRPPSAVLSAYGIDQHFVSEWRQRSSMSGERAKFQHRIRAALHLKSGFPFVTPFLIQSPDENRWMMIAHLSQHQAARDEMLQTHWDNDGIFTNFGSSDFYDLRYVASEDDDGSLFLFDAGGRRSMREALTSSLPERVWSYLAEKGEGASVTQLLSSIGNNTAATNGDLLDELRRMAQHGELLVQTRDGVTRRPATTPSVTDQITRPNQGILMVGMRPQPRK